MTKINLVKSTKAKASNEVMAQTTNNKTKTKVLGKKTKSQQELAIRISDFLPSRTDASINYQDDFADLFNFLIDEGVSTHLSLDGRILLSFPRIKIESVWIRSRFVMTQLRHHLSQKRGIPINCPTLKESTFKEFCSSLESLIKGDFESDKSDPFYPNRIVDKYIFRRCGYVYEGNKIYVDYDGDCRKGNNSVVEIDTNGYRVVENSPVIFIRNGSNARVHISPWGFNDWIYKLKKYINCDEDNFKLLVCYLVYSFFPEKCLRDRPILVLKGRSGSVNIELARLIKRIVDPYKVDSPTSKQMEDKWLSNCRDVSSIQDDSSDILCTISADIICNKDVMKDFDVDLSLILASIFMLVSDAFRELFCVALDRNFGSGEFARIGLVVEKSLNWNLTFCKLYEKNLISSDLTSHDHKSRNPHL